MKCKLCQLVNKVLNADSVKSEWVKEIDDLKLTGTIYEFDDSTEVIRLITDKFLFINSIRNQRLDYDSIVCLPLKHVSKEEYNYNEMDKVINKFVKDHYPHARVMENHGYASSVPSHAHKHIFYTKDTALKLDKIPEENFTS